MPNILNQVARRQQGFRPAAHEEFFALQLARALKDPGPVRTYVALAQRYPQPMILEAYRAVARMPAGELPPLEQMELALNARGE